MKENENYGLEETKFLEKAGDFFKRNLYNMMLFLVTIVFIFKDVFSIDRTDKTISEILVSSALSLAMGFTFNSIMGRKGIQVAQSTESYINMMNTYGEEIEKTNPHIDKLDDFLEKKNDERIMKAQIRILRQKRIKYSDFLEKEKEEVCKDKQQMKAWEKAINVKIQFLTPENILSETDDRYDKGKKDMTIQQYLKKQDVTTLSTKLIFALCFGAFGFSLIGTNIANIFWGVIQIATWLFFGMQAYITNVAYVKDVYQQKIYRKINYLVEFNNLYKEVKK